MVVWTNNGPMIAEQPTTTEMDHSRNPFCRTASPIKAQAQQEGSSQRDCSKSRQVVAMIVVLETGRAENAPTKAPSRPPCADMHARKHHSTPARANARGSV